MSQITIEIDDYILNILQIKADEMQKTTTDYAKQLLIEQLKKELRDWTEDEEQEFLENTKQFRQIDENDWKQNPLEEKELVYAHLD